MIPIPGSIGAFLLASAVTLGLGVGGGWVVRGWKADSHIAKRDQADAAASISAAYRNVKAIQISNADNTTVGANHVRMQKDLAALRSQAVDADKRRADLERLLDIQCPNTRAASVQSDAARGGTDAGKAERSIDYWLKSP